MKKPGQGEREKRRQGLPEIFVVSTLGSLNCLRFPHASAQFPRSYNARASKRSGSVAVPPVQKPYMRSHGGEIRPP